MPGAARTSSSVQHLYYELEILVENHILCIYFCSEYKPCDLGSVHGYNSNSLSRCLVVTLSLASSGNNALECSQLRTHASNTLAQCSGFYLYNSAFPVHTRGVPVPPFDPTLPAPPGQSQESPGSTLWCLQEISWSNHGVSAPYTPDPNVNQ